MSGYPEIRESVVRAGQMLLRERLVARTWGNVSCRAGGSSFAITPSGLSYEQTAPDDIVIYDMKTGTWEGSRKPSSEKGVHAAAYELFPEVGFVIHTHQIYASALSLTGFDALPPGTGISSLPWKVAVAGYGLPGTKKLMSNVREALAGGASAVLMRQHGALVVGRDMDEAFSRCKQLEAVCKDAARGQPEDADNTEAREKAISFTDVLRGLYPHTGFTSAAPVLKISDSGIPLYVQLDDMAQMVGAKLKPVPGDIKAIDRALQKRNVALVAGVGAICRAQSEGDCEALELLVEKACAAQLHTRALGVAARLPLWDIKLMRYIYKTKYSKLKEK